MSRVAAALVASVVGAAMLSACAASPAGSASGSALAPATAAPMTTWPTPSPGPTPGPTPTARPSDDSWPDWSGVVPTHDPPGMLLLAHLSWGDVGPMVQRLAILVDGRVVWEPRVDDGNGALIIARRLSPAGLAFVRSSLDAVGLFDRDRTRKLIKPLDCCGAGDELRVRNGNEIIHVNRKAANPASYAPSAEWDRFDALVEALRDVESWVPADGWLESVGTPYRARDFCLQLWPWDTIGPPSLEAEAINWPESTRPFETFGAPGPGFFGSGERTGTIDAAAAYALAASIAASANLAAIPRSYLYPVPFEEGGVELRAPEIIEEGVPWNVRLRALAPSEQCVETPP